ARRVDPGRVVVVSSLAKGFGVPLAVVGGPNSVIATLERSGEHQVHSSPPTVPELHAAYRALRINERWGERLRARLMGLVRRFRRHARAAGLALGSALFPVQSIEVPTVGRAVEMARALLQYGIRVVVHRAACRPAGGLSFVITALHRAADIDRAACALRSVVAMEGALGVRV